MGERPLIAVTGATGFVGKELLQDLARQSLPIRALARMRPGRQLPVQPATSWIEGDLSSSAALTALVDGADTLIHLAGVTKARAPAVFREVNALQTAELVRLAREAGVRHFIHVSSLAAERPHVSSYALSKADSEALATENAGAMALSIVRAPAVLGPGDDATRPLFSALARGYLPVPAGPAGKHRFSIIDVTDLSRFLVSLSAGGAYGTTSHAPAGHLNLSWREIAESAERVLSRPIHRIDIPPLLMKMAGQTADLAVKLGGKPQVFSGGKVKELLSGDWIAGTTVPDARTLDETLERCLEPFMTASREKREVGKERE